MYRSSPFIYEPYEWQQNNKKMKLSFSIAPLNFNNITINDKLAPINTQSISNSEKEVFEDLQESKHTL